MVLTASFVLSLVTGLGCHHRFADCSAKLDASVGASGPHDFAVRTSAVRPCKDCTRRCHVHRIPHPTSVTTAKRPSCEAGWRINKAVSTKRRNEIFFPTGLDRKSLGLLIDLPVGQITAWGNARTRERAVALLNAVWHRASLEHCELFVSFEASAGECASYAGSCDLRNDTVTMT
jgi:hypothetical protein